MIYPAPIKCMRNIARGRIARMAWITSTSSWWNKAPTPVRFDMLGLRARPIRRMQVFWLGISLIIAGSSHAAQSWRTFKSRDGFSISYPAGCVRSPPSEYRLELLDAPNGGAEGVVVAGGHVAVSVTDDEQI